MTIITTRQEYVSPIRNAMDRHLDLNPEKQIGYDCLKRLVGDLLETYKDLTRQYTLRPVLMHSMIPLPSNRLLGRTLTSEDAFIKRLAKRTDFKEVYCSPLETQANARPIIVDFEEAWPLEGEKSKLLRILAELTGGQTK